MRSFTVVFAGLLIVSVCFMPTACGASASDDGLQAAAVVIHVTPNGDDVWDGLSWATAKRTVQAGIDAAVSGSEVWVKAGTYYERITLKDGVGLYGGFSGSEIDLSQRDWKTNATVLDGSAAGTVVTVPSEAGPATVVDGFTIRNGNSEYGGGIYCYLASPFIRNNTITGNWGSTGGGIYCSHSSASVTNNIIATNRADYGGGLTCYNSSAVVANNTITGNSGRQRGGGIYCDGSSDSITNNTITANSTPTQAYRGGGICCILSFSSIANNIISHNPSGVYASGGLPTFRNNCVYAPGGSSYSGITDPTGTSGNISVDPRLAAWELGMAHVQPDSPCIDAGDDTAVGQRWTDVDGQTRVQGMHVDIGADESDGTLWDVTPRVVRVSTSGDDANDGSSWTLTKRTVQAGIDAASVDGGEVWVADGTYFERVTLKPYCYLYGGFSGNENTREERNWTANKSILDGNAGGSVVTVEDGYKIFSIDGFTIRNGSCCYGGGVYCYYSCPFITNNTVKGNSAAYSGGGIYCSFSSPAITNNTIASNTASGEYPDDGDGGGICCNPGSSPSITGNVVSGNRATDVGGGIFCCGSASVTNNVITRNSATYGGGVHGTGGSVTNNTITRNSAIYGGGIYGTRCVASNIIAHNSATYGGGVCNPGGSSVTNNTVVSNSATSNGGGLYCGSGISTVENNIVSHNSSGVYARSDGVAFLYGNCVYNPGTYNYSGVADQMIFHDVSADPLFVNRPRGDYHLQSGSPCINAGLNNASGIPEHDMDGEPRIQDWVIDIGADERPVPPAAGDILSAKLQRTGLVADIPGAIISAAFIPFFYIESDDRLQGIRVQKMGHGLKAGMRVRVVGPVTIAFGGEKLIDAALVEQAGSGTVSPLFITNLSLGGSAFSYDAVVGSGQMGIAGGMGLNNIGLFIRTLGTVTAIGESCVYIDDGSSLSDGTTAGGALNRGIRVICDPREFAVGDYLEVTGISSCFSTTTFAIARQVLATEIRKLSP